jgi:hypothetical protein
VCVTSLLNCVLGLEVHLKKEAVCFQNVAYCFEYFCDNGRSSNAADVTHVQPLPKTCMLQCTFNLETM